MMTLHVSTHLLASWASPPGRNSDGKALPIKLIGGTFKQWMNMAKTGNRWTCFPGNCMNSSEKPPPRPMESSVGFAQRPSLRMPGSRWIPSLFPTSRSRKTKRREVSAHAWQPVGPEPVPDLKGGTHGGGNRINFLSGCGNVGGREGMENV